MKAYQLKITIKDSHPPIWRRIIVPAGLSFSQLLDSANYIIDEFFEQVKSFTYVYDFGDDWRHQVQIENVIYDYEVD